MYFSGDKEHKIERREDNTLSRRTISIDCRYETICALYHGSSGNINDSDEVTDAQNTNTQNPNTQGAYRSYVQCLGEPEWLLPWSATSIVRGAGFACVMLDDVHSSVYCWGESRWGNV